MKVTNCSVSFLSSRGLRAWGTRLLAAALVLGAANSVSAQSDRDIREENARLRAQVAELQAELDAARSVIESLSERIAELERALRAAGGRPEAPADDAAEPTESEAEPEVTIDESVPNASPRALFNALLASYEETMDDTPIGTDGSRERVLFMRELGRWVARVNRDFRSQIEWHVRVIGRANLAGEGVRGRGGERFTLRAVDPVTNAPLGDAFDVPVSAAQVRRLRQFSNQFATEVFVLRGVLTPQVRLSPARLTKGPFNNPPFIGPMAEFAFTVDIRTLFPAPPDDEPADGDRDADTGDGDDARD